MTISQHLLHFYNALLRLQM